MKKSLFLLLAILLVQCSNKHPDIILPAEISDHMVLQQKNHANLWGKCTPGTIVKVEAGWGTSAKVRADNKGIWRVSLNTPEYGGPYTLKFKAKKTIKVLNDVFIGEVWLCAGQSNMEMPLKGWLPNDTIDNSLQEIAKANYPGIRMFTVEKQMAFRPLGSCSGKWEVCSPETAPEFSAAAYFFAQKLYKELHMPIGLLQASWGGTPAEAWTDARCLGQVDGFRKITKQLQAAASQRENMLQFLLGLEKTDLDKVKEKNPFRNLNKNDTLFLAENTRLVQWHEINVPALWEKDELSGFDGVVWLKRDFEIPSHIYPEGFQLYLGPIDDMDQTYVNGVKIGETLEPGHYQKERKYPIPAKVLKEGKNTVWVKVIDTGGAGGIYGPGIPAIYKGNQKIADLSGRWLYAPSAYYLNHTLYFFGQGEKSYEKLPQVDQPLDSHTPSALFNGMIAPLCPYTLKGVIWYQGESNVGRGSQYKSLFPALIKSWRAVWGENSFPFYYVQIAPYNYGEGAGHNVALLREAQLETMKVKNTGMVVTMDIGNPNNIHPGNKKEVGRRLALWALHHDYGKDVGEFSGPLVSNVNFKNGSVEIKFLHAQNGLVLKESEITYFEVAGKDETYIPVWPQIEENKIILKTQDIKKPKYVRYAWGDDVEPNLFNAEGLPASPFRDRK